MLAVVLLLVACAPRAVERPREGAAPIVGGTPVRLENIAPPTLAAAAALALPSTPTAVLAPSPVIALSPVASPGLLPIISGLQPAPGANLPAGDVVIGARISGSSNLVDITAFVDGEAVPIELEGPAVRVKQVSIVRTFDGGTHEVRVQARDDRGQLGGYRWQFSIGAGRQAPAAPTPRPATATPAVQPRTPAPVPTRRPTTGPTAAQPAAPTATRVPAR